MQVTSAEALFRACSVRQTVAQSYSRQSRGNEFGATFERSRTLAHSASISKEDRESLVVYQDVREQSGPSSLHASSDSHLEMSKEKIE